MSFFHKHQNQQRRINKFENLSHRHQNTTTPLHNGAHWHKDLPGQALQTVKSQQVLHAAKENVSANSTTEIHTKLTHSSTAVNSTSSQLLLLPIELRYRIYDYTFGSNLVRITAHPQVENNTKSICYRISSRTCERHDAQMSPRVRSFEYDIEPEAVFAEFCDDCSARQESVARNFSLPLLQVCRQVYHEAALKPFQQATFVYDFDEHCSRGEGLQAFMRALVPAQAKAITNLQLSCPHPAFLKTTTLARLKSLKHLGIQLGWKITSADQVLGLLENFESDPIVLALAELGLNSIRLELGLHIPGRCIRAMAALLGRSFNLPTVDDAKVFEEILKRTETTLLKSVD